VSMNIFVLQGTVCKGYDDSEPVKTGETKKGTLWANCRLSVYDFFTKENAYFDIGAFGKMAEILQRANAKDEITVSGRIVIEKWTGRDGQKRITHKYMAEKISLPRSAAVNPDQHQPPAGTPDEGIQGPIAEDDDLPF